MFAYENAMAADFGNRVFGRTLVRGGIGHTDPPAASIFWQADAHLGQHLRFEGFTMPQSAEFRRTRPQRFRLCMLDSSLHAILDAIISRIPPCFRV